MFIISLYSVSNLNFKYAAPHLKFSAKDLNSQTKILVSGQGFESGFQEYSINPD